MKTIPSPVHTQPFRRTGTRPSRFDAHDQLITELCREYGDPGMKCFSLKRALEARPELKQVLGLHTIADVGLLRQHVARRLKLGHYVMGKQPTELAPVKRAYRKAAPAAPVATAQWPINYCPKCGCNLTVMAQAIAIQHLAQS